MKVTAKDIAEKLGISPSSVSLAINGKAGVSDETREKVLAAATRMGYAINKPPAPGTTQNIRYVIFLEDGATVKETSFYSIILRGIEEKAKEHNYNVIISYFYSSGNWEEQIAAACKDVSGIIVLATEITDRHIKKANQYGLGKVRLPIVLVDNATTLCDVDCVVSDGVQGAFKAASYLLEKGHPDVGYLRSKDRIDNFDERERGVRKARKEGGVSASIPLQTVEVGIASEDAFDNMNEWLKQGGKPLSAYFADNDIIAAASIRALKAQGYRIPQDVSIAGYDDMPICTMVDPTLTTIRVMKTQMGTAAMEILNERIVGEAYFLSNKELGVCRVTISTHMIERESVAEYKENGGN